MIEINFGLFEEFCRRSDNKKLTGRDSAEVCSHPGVIMLVFHWILEQNRYFCEDQQVMFCIEVRRDRGVAAIVIGARSSESLADCTELNNIEVRRDRGVAAIVIGARSSESLADCAELNNAEVRRDRDMTAVVIGARSS